MRHDAKTFGAYFTPEVVADEHADRPPRTPTKAVATLGSFLAPKRYSESGRSVATLPGSAGELEDVRHSHGGIAGVLGRHVVGPAARCRWPWTLTVPAGTLSSSMWVRTSGGSVARWPRSGCRCRSAGPPAARPGRSPGPDPWVDSRPLGASESISGRSRRRSPTLRPPPREVSGYGTVVSAC